MTHHADPATAYPIHPGDTTDDGTVAEVNRHNVIIERPANMPGQTQPWTTVIQRQWIDGNGMPTRLGSVVFASLASTVS